MPVSELGLVTTLLAALGGYLLGSVPFGIVVARAFGLGDLRQIGSGNIGTTNVLRAGGKLPAALTLIGDAGKGAVAVLIARALWDDGAAQVAGLFAFAGHLWPVWLGFRGGKGVATFLGTLLALSFPLGAAACLTWLAVALVFRMSSLAALVASASAWAWALFLGVPSYALLSGVLAALVWIKHRANIGRILRGEEPKIGRK